MSPAAKQTRCGWNDAAEACYAAIGGEEKYASLARARWFVLTALAFALIGVAVLGVSHVGPWTTSPFVIAALATGAAITLVRSNVPSALASFAGARVETNGSGLMAAQIATLVCFVAALIAAIPARPSPPSSRSEP